MEALRMLTDGLLFPEGPSFDRTGTLFVVETAPGLITAIEPDGTKRTHAEPGGGPNGTVFGIDGGLYVANNGGIGWDGARVNPDAAHGHGRIERVATDGSVAEVYASCEGVPLDGPNDITTDDAGWLWFTDPGHGDIKEDRGRVFAAAPDGSAIHLVADGYQFCNGLAFTPDFRSLIVAETGSGRLWIHPVLADRRLGERAELARLPRGYKPDGMCLDEEGNVLVAGTFGGALFAFGPSGDLLERTDIEDPLVTNLAFGGADHDEVFVTVNKTGRVEVMRWSHRGLELPFTGAAA